MKSETLEVEKAKNPILEKLQEHIIEIRRAKGLTQVAFAKLIDRPASQICRIEKGRFMPHDAALKALGQALGCGEDYFIAYRSKLIDMRNKGLSFETGPSPELDPMSEGVAFDGPRLQLIHHDKNLDEILPAVQDEILPQLDEYLRLQHSIGMPDVDWMASAGLWIGDRGEGKDGAEHAAEEIRESLRIGQAPLPQAIPLIEACNIRVLHLHMLPANVFSLSFFDRAFSTTVICLNAERTPEKQLFQLAKELGYAIVFRKNHRQTIEADTGEAFRPFVAAFASSLLMPKKLLLKMRYGLLLEPEYWTLEMICELKGRFGVSAEALLRQLDTLKLISPAVYDGILGEIQAHYDCAQGDSAKMEPAPCAPPLPKDVWLRILRARAGIVIGP